MRSSDDTRPFITQSRAQRLPTAFSVPLRELFDRVPGARGTIFLDYDGEAIDDFAYGPTVEIQLVGAHLGIILSLVREQTQRLGAPTEVFIETEQAKLAIRAVDDKYLVVLEAGADSQLAVMSRELERTVLALRSEM